MADKEKYRKVCKMHEHYKGVMLRWENAMYKIKGHKPTKEDFESAPKEVREAYKQYHKYKKYLAKHANTVRHRQSSSSSSNKKSTTPSKIFDGFHSQSLHSFEKTSGSDGTKKKADNDADEIQKGGEVNHKKKMMRTISEKLFSIPPMEPCKRKLKPLLTRNKVDVTTTTTPPEGVLATNDGHQSHDVSSDIDIEISETVLSFFEEQNSQFSETLEEFTAPAVSDESMMDSQCFTDIDTFDLSHSVFIPTTSFVTPFNNSNNDSSRNNYNYNVKDLLFVEKPQEETSVNVTPGASVENNNVPVESEMTTPPPRPPSPPQEAPKRKFALAFSPSPEKQQPKRKFFKSDRREKRYTLKSGIVIPPLDTKVQKKKVNKPVENTEKVVSTVDKNLKPIKNSEFSEKCKKSVSLKNPPTTATDHKKFNDESKKSSPTKKSTSKIINKKSNKKSVPATSSSSACNRPTGGRKQSAANAEDDAYDNDYNPSEAEKKTGKTGKSRGFLSRNNRGRPKKINDNFVRIDVTKKVFVRGRKRMTGAKMKRLDWKIKKSTSAREKKLSLTTCKKCGEVGHFAKFCLKDRVVSDLTVDTGLEVGNEEVDNSPWPTVEEAKRMIWKKPNTDTKTFRCVIYENQVNSQPSTTTTAATIDNDQSKDTVDMLENNNETSCTSEPLDQTYEAFEIAKKPVEPLSFGPYINESTGLNDDVKDSLSKSLQLFGYESFRHGQKETVVRVLSGQSTLLISSTGSGKSLCYQLPAYLYAKKYPGALTLCISPLVSLMEDQVEGLPNFLHGVALHCQLSAKKKEQNIELVKNKKVQVLLASPEAVASGLFGLFRSGNMPNIAFACIDEVHCVSEWSHNFRPTYLELCKILRDKLNVKTILGLTATATTQTEVSICEHLKIDPSNTVRGEIVPNNLNLSVSRDQDKNLALLNLLRGDRFKDCNSIIIYCTTREDCDRVATFVRTNLQDNASFNSVIPIARSRISTNCEAYHARLSTARRRYVQKHFMSGNIRIVVATIAFGMGIDKSDIRAVIHYNMSKTFELYVQEIGRAGRDGLPGQCHLFLDNIKGKDLSELRKHIYSNSVDRATIRRLLKRIFKPCKCSKRTEAISKDVDSTSQTTPNNDNSENTKRCPGHEVAFSYEQVVKDLDLPGENISTLLCFMELDKRRKWIEILPMTYAICKIHSYGGPKLLKAAALKCPALAVAIALEKEKKKFKDGDVYLEFNVVEAASTVGWSSAIVKRELKNLEWAGNQFDAQGNATKFRKTGILVEFSELAYRVKAPGDLTDDELDEVLAYVCGINSEQERTQLYQLYKLYQSFYVISSPNVAAACDDFNAQGSETLKGAICDYFRQENQGVPSTWKPPQQGIEKEDEIRRDIASLIYSNKDTPFTGRAIAKILQGIGSPCFPAEDWCRNRAFWRRYLDVDFHFLSKIASEEILHYA